MRGNLDIIQDRLLIRVILALDRHGGRLTTKRLIAALDTSPTHVLAAVDRAVRYRLLTRTELKKIEGWGGGQKVRLISLTQKGKEIVNLAKELGV